MLIVYLLIERVDIMKTLIEILHTMSLEELLEHYKEADTAPTLAEANLLRLLITAELDNRITGK